MKINHSHFRQYREIFENEFFVIACDCSMGAKDFCAAQFISKTKLDIPIVYHAPVITNIMTNEIFPVLQKLNKITGIKPVICYERNNGGMFELDRLATMNRLDEFDIYFDNNNKLGWDTNTATRPKMLQDIKECIENRLLTIYDKPTVEEMFSFILCQTSTIWKAQAEKNAHDDLVMALAIAYQLYLSVPIPTQKTGQNNYDEPVYQTARRAY